MTFAGMGASFFLLALAMKRLPLGTAYVVWTGIGAVGSASLGMAHLGVGSLWRKLYSKIFLTQG